MNAHKILLQILLLILFSCKPAKLENPCDLNGSSYWLSLLLKIQTGDFGSYCGSNLWGNNGLRISYSEVTYVFFQGSPITSIVPTKNAAISSCNISPSLPTGLNLSPTDCSIAGTPLVSQSMTSYTVTATNSTSVAKATLSLQVKTRQAKYVVVPNAGSNSLSIFTIDTNTGALSLNAGSPVTPGNLSSPRFVAVHPNGTFFYIANGTGASVSGFSIDSSNGNITSLGTAFAAPYNVYAITIDPTGNYLYASSYSSKAVNLYSINQSTGSLTSIQSFNATSSAGGQTGPLIIDPTGKYMFTGNTDSPGILDVFSINATNGYLTLLGSPGPYSNGNNNIAVTVDPLGKFVYAGYYSQTYVSGFSFNSSTGALTQMSGSPYAASANSATFITVEATGKFLYLANSGNATISGFSIDPSSGSLTSISGSPFTGSASPSVVYADPTSSYLYCANTAGTGTISGFVINKSTGALTQIAGSPWGTGASNPFGLGIIAY